MKRPLFVRPCPAEIIINTDDSRPSLCDGLGRIFVERFSDGRWYAAVYWTQLPAYAHQGVKPIAYAHGEFGATLYEAVANLRAEMGLSCP